MIDLILTHHIRKRTQQRGGQSGDHDLIYKIGTNVPGGVLLRTRDVQEFEHQAKRILSRLRKLEGKFIATSGNVAKTTYRATKKQQKRMLR